MDDPVAFIAKPFVFDDPAAWVNGGGEIERGYIRRKILKNAFKGIVIGDFEFCDFALNAYFSSKENSRGYNRRNRTPYIHVSFSKFKFL